MAGCLMRAVNMHLKHEIAGLDEQMSASHEMFCLFALTAYLEPCNDRSSAPYRFVKLNVCIYRV